MAGLYIHIPFCRSRCAYCDFFSTTREAEQAAYVPALCREMELRSHEMGPSRVRTIYLGGGTPSLLTPAHLGQILNAIHAHYEVEEGAEVTLEMNPDDVGPSLPPAVAAASRGPVFNRVSLGIQTFHDALLRLICRRHDAATAIRAVRALQQQGFRNISIDLIYGLPGQTIEQWEHDLDTAFSLSVQHLSAYALSYEPGTRLTRWRDEGRIREASDELSVAMYERLCQRARQEGFEHYEISNFALPGYHSRHNSSYWTGDPYWGFGPGAHSYDGLRTRRANHSLLNSYLAYWAGVTAGQEAGEKPFTLETLTDDELYDEAVMCGLRTAAGIDLERLRARMGDSRWRYLLSVARPHLSAGRLVMKENHLCLAPQSLMTSDDIMSDLMAEPPLGC